MAREAPLLRDAMHYVAHPPIRNRGTLVGAVAHADPASELPAVVALLDAVVRVRSAAGRRRVPARAFFRGPLEPELAEGEWVEQIDVPAQPGPGAVREIARRHGDYAICGVAAVARPADSGELAVDLTWFGLGDVPRIVTLAAAQVVEVANGGDAPVTRLVEDLGELPDDVHASGAYRARLARQLAAAVVREIAGAPR